MQRVDIPQRVVRLAPLLVTHGDRAMQPNLPNVARLSTRLAADNSRVAGFIECMAQRVDGLMGALQQGDVAELHRLSEDLAVASDSCGFDTIRYRAERVCEELLKPNNVRGIKRSVVHLIGACGVRRAEQGDHDDWQI